MIYTNNKQVGLSANEVNNLVTKLIENKQDKKIVFEGQEMLLTTALQRINNSAVGKANIIDAEILPDTLTPNSQYWVKTYNGQTIDNGRYIILVDNLGTPHFMGESTSVPVVDIQINGNSIIDGATQIANIQPKTVIDDTVTENDIPSAKGVRDLVNSKHLYLHTLTINCTSAPGNYKCNVNMFTNTSDKIDTPIKLWNLMNERGYNSNNTAYPITGGAAYNIGTTPTNITRFYTSTTKGLFRFEGNQGLGKSMDATLLNGGTLTITSEFKSLTYGAIPDESITVNDIVVQIF